jgi:hypothetical protein
MIEAYTITLAAIGALALVDKLLGLILRLYREGLNHE